MRTTIEIFKRETDEVVETQEVEMRTFLFYWEMQGNDDDYGWREKDES